MKNTLKIIVVFLFLLVLAVYVFIPTKTKKMDELGILQTFIPYEMKVAQDAIQHDPGFGATVQLTLKDRPLVETEKWYRDKGFEIIEDNGVIKGFNHAGASFILMGNNEKSRLIIHYLAVGKK